MHRHICFPRRDDGSLCFPVFDADVGEGCSRDHPDAFSCAFKPDAPDGPAAEVEPGQIEPERRADVLAGPADHGIVDRPGRPEVCDLMPGSDIEGKHFAVDIFSPFGFNGHGADFRPGRSLPRDAVEQIEVTSGFPLRGELRRGGEAGAFLAAQHDAALFTVGDIERDPGEGLFSGREHTQVVVRALVGPAAPAVFSNFISKTHIRGALQRKRRTFVRREMEMKLQLRVFDHSGARRRIDAQLPRFVFPLAAVLKVAGELSGDCEGSHCEREHDRMRRMGKVELGLLRLVEFRPETDGFAVDRDGSRQEFQQRQRGFEPEGVREDVGVALKRHRVVDRVRPRGGDPLRHAEVILILADRHSAAPFERTGGALRVSGFGEGASVVLVDRPPVPAVVREPEREAVHAQDPLALLNPERAGFGGGRHHGKGRRECGREKQKFFHRAGSPVTR